MTLQGTLTGGTIVLDHPVPFPEGTRVEVLLKPLPATAGTSQLTLREMLLKHAGTVPDLPPDMAEQHDHYIHGTPKR